MKLSIREKKVLYAFACPNHHNTVTRLDVYKRQCLDWGYQTRPQGYACYSTGGRFCPRKRCLELFEPDYKRRPGQPLSLCQ